MSVVFEGASTGLLDGARPGRAARGCGMTSGMRRFAPTALSDHPFLLAIALLVGVLGAGSSARATGQQEWVVVVTPEYVAQRVDDQTEHGVGLHLDVGYGLQDWVSLQGTIRYAYLPPWGVGGPRNHQVGGVGVGPRFTFDMFRAIPFVSLSVGAAALYRGASDAGLPAETRWNAEIVAGAGADWLIRRDFSVGFELRYALLVPDAKRFPFAFTLGLRLAWRRD